MLKTNQADILLLRCKIYRDRWIWVSCIAAPKVRQNIIWNEKANARLFFIEAEFVKFFYTWVSFYYREYGSNRAKTTTLCSCLLLWLKLFLFWPSQNSYTFELQLISIKFYTCRGWFFFYRNLSCFIAGRFCFCTRHCCKNYNNSKKKQNQMLRVIGICRFVCMLLIFPRTKLSSLSFWFSLQLLAKHLKHM